MMPGTMVLVHGAWQGGWAWDAWRPVLAARGWKAVAVDLPGNGCDPADATLPHEVTLDRYVEHVVASVRACGEPVVLVGHSGGGITVTQVAEAVPELVRAVVYLAGMMLPHEVTFAQLIRDARASGLSFPPGIVPHLQWNASRTVSVVPPAAARSVFLQDCDAALALAASARLRPQPEGGRAMAPRLDAGRYGAIPRIYVEATQDQSIGIALQRHMQALSPGAHRLTLDCGHVPQLVRPDALADLLLPALARGIG